MAAPPKSTIQQNFNATLPESFEKKIITTLLAEDLQDQKMMLKFYREWRQEAREEKKFFLGFLADQEEKACKHEEVQLFRENAQLISEMLEEIQAMVDEFNDQYAELQQEEILLNLYEDELSTIDSELVTSFNELFKSNTDFAQERVSMNEDEQSEYLKFMDGYIQEEAALFAKNAQSMVNFDFDMDFQSKIAGLMDGVTKKITDCNDTNKPNVPQIKRMQVADKIVGKPEQKHNELQKKKFKLACKKAICLQKMVSLNEKLASKKENGIAKIEHFSHQVSHKPSTPTR